MTMNDAQFDTFVANSLRRVNNTSDWLNAEYGIGNFDKWDLQQESGLLEFSDESGIRVVCDVVAIGSLANGIWKWAWSNSSILPSFSRDSRKLKMLAETTGMDIFSGESFSVDENMPWELCGMALQELNGIGIYRCGPEEPSLFVLIKSANNIN